MYIADSFAHCKPSNRKTKAVPKSMQTSLPRSGCEGGGETRGQGRIGRVL